MRRKVSLDSRCAAADRNTLSVKKSKVHIQIQTVHSIPVTASQLSRLCCFITLSPSSKNFRFLIKSMTKLHVVSYALLKQAHQNFIKTCLRVLSPLLMPLPCRNIFRLAIRVMIDLDLSLYSLLISISAMGPEAPSIAFQILVRRMCDSQFASKLSLADSARARPPPSVHRTVHSPCEIHVTRAEHAHSIGFPQRGLPAARRLGSASSASLPRLLGARLGRFAGLRALRMRGSPAS